MEAAEAAVAAARPRQRGAQAGWEAMEAEILAVAAAVEEEVEEEEVMKGEALVTWSR